MSKEIGGCGCSVYRQKVILGLTVVLKGASERCAAVIVRSKLNKYLRLQGTGEKS